MKNYKKKKSVVKSNILDKSHILNKIINKEVYLADKKGTSVITFKSVEEISKLIDKYRAKFERALLYFEDIDNKTNKQIRKACILNAGVWRVISSKNNRQLFIIDKFAKQRQLWPIVWKKYSTILSFKNNDIFMECMFNKDQLKKYNKSK